eukprot:GEMP01021039.1.p1 GENE.GEMP01021039.1~~GEMP01021039.1.p1  ORF type:complete len:619 (+),score=151.55 GEMP01021039.1:113-1969(+)
MARQSSCPQRPTSAPPARLAPTGAKRPLSAGPARPASAGPARPASAGPVRPASAGPARRDEGVRATPSAHFRPGSGRAAERATHQRMVDQETLEEDLRQLRKQLWTLQKQNATRRHQLLSAEKENVRLDKLVLEILSAVKVHPQEASRMEMARQNLQLLVEAKKKAGELRALVGERQMTIRSINKELKATRVAELQQLVHSARLEVNVQKKSWESYKSTHTFVESKKYSEKCQQLQQELVRLETELGATYSKHELLRETCDCAVTRISHNRKRVEEAQAEINEVTRLENKGIEESSDHKFDLIEEEHAKLTATMERKCAVLRQLRFQQIEELDKLQNNQSRVEIKALHPEFEITKDPQTWQLLLGLRHCARAIVRLPPEDMLTDRAVRNILKAELPGIRAGSMIDGLHPLLIDKSGRMIKWLDLCVSIHGPFLSNPRGPLVKENAIIEAMEALAERCKELRVPESLIKDTLRHPVPMALLYVERLGLDSVYHDTLRCVLYTQGPSVIVRYLPTWRVFTIEDDVSLARRFLKQEIPTPAHSVDQAARTDSDKGIATQRFRDNDIARLPNTFSEAERARITYLFAQPDTKRIDVKLPIPKVSRAKLAELTYHRIAVPDDG